MWPWCDLVAFHLCSWRSAAFSSGKLWACACMLPDGDGAPFCIRSHLNDCEVDLKTSRQIRDFPPQRFSSGHTKGLPIGIILSFVLLTSMKLPSLVYVLLNFCLTFFLLYIVTILGDDAYLVKVLSSLVEDALSSPSWNGYNWRRVQKGCCCSVLGCTVHLKSCLQLKKAVLFTVWRLETFRNGCASIRLINSFTSHWVYLSVFADWCDIQLTWSHFFCSQPAVIITIIRTIIALSPSYKLFTADAQ